GAFATGTASGQLGLFIPGFQALKVFIQGMGRGFPSYVKKDQALPFLPDGQAPIHLQGMVGGGLAFAPHDRVDLSVEVQRGFGGGIAPWAMGRRNQFFRAERW
ncbi:MAG TPA: hypothetical protein PKI03_34310, partial [Pseudomonadota bacterium]|nr:hypothetical protein [Pseudomonadota bacterium]